VILLRFLAKLFFGGGDGAVEEGSVGEDEGGEQRITDERGRRSA